MNEPKDKPAGMIIDNVITRFGIPTVIWPRKPLGNPNKQAIQAINKALPKGQKQSKGSRSYGKARRTGELSDY